MWRVYIAPETIKERGIRVEGGNFHYIKNVLRLRKEDRIFAFDGNGKEYRCILRELYPEHLELEVIEVFEEEKENGIEISLAQSLLKAKHFELVLQKCVELGVKTFIPVVTERTVVRLKAERLEKRKSRWIKIANEAAKQSRGVFLPQVSNVLRFEDSLKLCMENDLCIMPSEEEKDLSLVKALEGRSCGKIMVFIGPEGGWTDSEFSSAKKAGAIPVSLGRRILRSETAAIATVAIIQSVRS